MKKGAMAILLMTLASQAIGAEQNEPWIKPFTDVFRNGIMDSLANGKGGLADAARKDRQARELQQKEANRSERRTVKECIKPGNVIDDDVQECVRGYRERTW